MNIYYLAFKYKGDVNVVKVTANELANELLGHTDDIIEFQLGIDKELKDSQYFYQKLYIVDQDYVVEFSDKNPGAFTICECEEEESIDGQKSVYAGTIIEPEVPWICIKIEDDKGNELYNLGKEI